TVVGNVASGVGTLTMAGGTNNTDVGFDVGENAGSTGAVWVTGGLLMATNDNEIVGLSGVGQMTLSNGVVRFHSLTVGDFNRGTLTIAGGTYSLSSELIIGTANTGTVWLTGGQ